MSELFDSLNLSNSSAAGPPSSQQSSSQPSTSKVFWHASPSPGVLRQLHNWTPNKSQDSPTLPLCTQAFVGELKKLPGALESQSPLVSRRGKADSTKRKLIRESNSRHVSDPTPNRGKVGEYITLDLSDHDDDDDDDDHVETEPKRLLLGDVGESSPESTRRRIMHAGNTGRMRQLSSPGQLSSSTNDPPPLLERDASSHRRIDRRPPRRRKKESFMAGLGFTDDSGRATDCLKLFENLQAAIQGMHASRPSTSGSDSNTAITTNLPTVSLNRDISQGGSRLTQREGINRTASAPSGSRTMVHSQEAGLRSSQIDNRAEEGLQPRKGFRAVKSDHDVFRAVAGDHASVRALQPRPVNIPIERQVQNEDEMFIVKTTTIAPGESVRLSQTSQSRQQDTTTNKNSNHVSSQPRSVPLQALVKSISTPTEALAVNSNTIIEVSSPIQEASRTVTSQVSPIKRSARIEAMQQQTNNYHHHTKKLGTRGPSLLHSKSASCSPRKPSSIITVPTTSTSTSSSGSTPIRKMGNGVNRARTHALTVGTSQARQVGLPRSSSQFAVMSSASQSQTSSLTNAGPAAPFRPPVISRTNVVSTITTNPPVKIATAKTFNFDHKQHQPSSSDDSFDDHDDDAFLALACQLEY
ncbi:uncharacterized protein MEPE_00177 [Melanopsichium pennsylvanicum]|uniref:Uncharacterized protein n=2 Tax=Melanopsichium pennsylvanicum TaxID=63383 RepID=A0AAJ4XFN1_9BASI|nr:hypothetical protein BN887_02086 [Melanopsichium pennsylvanicum 4]SNX81472.1 uncharacterized protein MEPE_00177 [Melanopsichium pennsylvanicum]